MSDSSPSAGRNSTESPTRLSDTQSAASSTTTTPAVSSSVTATAATETTSSTILPSSSSSSPSSSFAPAATVVAVGVTDDSLDDVESTRQRLPHALYPRLPHGDVIDAKNTLQSHSILAVAYQHQVVAQNEAEQLLQQQNDRAATTSDHSTQSSSYSAAQSHHNGNDAQSQSLTFLSDVMEESTVRFSNIQANANSNNRTTTSHADTTLATSFRSNRRSGASSNPTESSTTTTDTTTGTSTSSSATNTASTDTNTTRNVATGFYKQMTAHGMDGAAPVLENVKHDDAVHETETKQPVEDSNKMTAGTKTDSDENSDGTKDNPAVPTSVPVPLLNQSNLSHGSTLTMSDMEHSAQAPPVLVAQGRLPRVALPVVPQTRTTAAATADAAFVDAQVLYEPDGQLVLPLPMQAAQGVVAEDVEDGMLLASSSRPGGAEAGADGGDGCNQDKNGSGNGSNAKRRRTLALALVGAAIVISIVVGGVCGGTGACRRTSPPSTSNNESSTASTITSPTTTATQGVSQQVEDYINTITMTGRKLDLSVDGTSLEERALYQLLLNSPVVTAPNTSQAQAVWRQRYALATLLSNRASFSNTVNECDWTGVTCEVKEDLNVVTALDFSAVNVDISGSISADLGLLSHLVTVNFAQSAWTGTLPESCGNWTELVSFDAWGNSLTGKPPSSLGAWTKLEHFNVWGNAWTGSLPSSYGQWTNLRYFNAESNMLRGSLPSSFGQWTSVEYFNIQENSMTGSIPDTVANWISIQEAFFHFNDFTGTAPSGICSVANVTKLYADCGEVACSSCWTST